MKYKGIEGQYHYNKDMKMFVGELRNTTYLVTFTGGSPKDIQQSFKKAVESYLYSLKKDVM